jgi:predicted small secreted protein
MMRRMMVAAMIAGALLTAGCRTFGGGGPMLAPRHAVADR